MLILAFAGLGVAVAAVWLRHRFKKRRLVWVGAFLEQGRVENEHHTPFRDDQRMNAIQQRLSRHLGARSAFGPKTRRRIEREIARMRESAK